MLLKRFTDAPRPQLFAVGTNDCAVVIEEAFFSVSSVAFSIEGQPASSATTTYPLPLKFTDNLVGYDWVLGNLSATFNGVPLDILSVVMLPTSTFEFTSTSEPPPDFSTATISNGLSASPGPYYTTTPTIGGVVTSVPEPSSLALLGVGAMSALIFGWRRGRKAS